MSPETLTHIVYVVLVVSFVSVMAFMLVYNARAKARQKTLQPQGRPFRSHEAGIMAAQISAKQERRQG